MQERSTENAIWRVDFDSVSEMIDWIDAAPNQSDRCASGVMLGDPKHIDNGAEWYGTASYAEANRLVREGWPEGRAALDRAYAAMAPLAQARGRINALGYDVAGAYPIVPMAVAGEPACMVTVGEQERATRPYIKFLCSMGTSSAVSAKTVQARGAAILSWVDALEQAGARCEVVITMSQKRGGRDGTLDATAMAKRADEPLDIDRMAYVMTNPSFFRRQAFALIERAPHGLGNKMGLGYGMPLDIPDLAEQNAVVFTSAMWGNPAWKSPAAATAYVKAEILKACGDLNGMLDAA